MEFLYTFFFEFQGGTYIDQVTAIDEKQAMRKWATQLSHKEIQGLGQRTKQHLIEKIEEEKAIAANGVTNIWSFGILFAGRYGNVVMVKTVS